MARDRVIRPEFFRDDDIGRLSPVARLTLILLPCYADDAGFLFEDLDLLKAQILPFDAVDMETVVAELAAAGHILRFLDPSGRGCIQFTSWDQRASRYYGSLWPAARSAAARRDGGRCVECQATEALEVHHIRPLRLFGSDIEAAHDLANLITLCKSCHGLADAEFRRKERGT